MNEHMTTSGDRRALWKCALVVAGVILFWLALFASAKADDGGSMYGREAKSAYAHAPQKHRKTVTKQATLIPHPAGCPRRAFCACGAAVEIFGRPIRSLWPSTAWFKFPRSAPAPNTVAVRRGHIFVLKNHVQGNVWMVNDYNSGGHQSRYHARSIAGYTIVQPVLRMAMNQGG